MAFTLLDLKSDTVDVSDAFLDRTDEGLFVLKQYGGEKNGDWVVLTPSMLRQLAYWSMKECI